MKMKTLRAAAAGLGAGAAGTTALNAVTYLDMAVRGRPSSSTPEASVEKLAEKGGVDIPGDPGTRQNRLQGLGPLTGLVTGTGIGAVMGVARRFGFHHGVLTTGMVAGAAAMAGTDAPMARLGVTQPGQWTFSEWLSDAVPHLAYGVVTAAVLDGLHRD
jgi:hypothetical protein